MDRLALGPAGASAFLVLLVLFGLYGAGLTVWAHIAGERLLGEHDTTRDDADDSVARRWPKRVAALYAAGWVVFAWGTVALGFLQGGPGFASGRGLLIGVWLVSPLGVYGLALAYWSYWTRTGVPTSKP